MCICNGCTYYIGSGFVDCSVLRTIFENLGFGVITDDGTYDKKWLMSQITAVAQIYKY